MHSYCRVMRLRCPSPPSPRIEAVVNEGRAGERLLGQSVPPVALELSYSRYSMLQSKSAVPATDSVNAPTMTPSKCSCPASGSTTGG